MTTDARNPMMDRLEPLVGTWQLDAVQDGRRMSTATTTIRWSGERGLLPLHTDPPTHLVSEWDGLAPVWVDAAYGVDDHSGAFSGLYADSRGVCRAYTMTFEGRRWTLGARPGDDFHQRFHSTLSEDGDTIDGAWERSDDGVHWETDFDVRYRRIG